MTNVKKLKILFISFLAVLFLSCMGIFLSVNDGNKVFASEINDTSISEITTSIVGDNLYLNIIDSESSLYQVWMKSRLKIHEIGSVEEYSDLWVLVNNGFNSYPIGGFKISNYIDYQIDDYYYIVIRIKNGEEITEYYEAIAVTDTMACIDSITFGEGQGIKEVNYLEIGDVNIQITGNALATQGFTITDFKDTYTSVDGVISYPVKEGLYTATITAVGGASQDIVIKGYYSFENYTKISSIQISDDENNILNFGENYPLTNSNINLQVNTETVGEGSSVTAKLTIAGNTIPLPNLNIEVPISFGDYNLGYGIHQFKVSLINSSGLVEDYYTGYYNYSRSENAPDITVSQPIDNGNGSYTISASSPSNFGNNIVYQFVKWDAKGEYVVKDWSDLTSITVILFNDGVYRFEVRAKSDGADSFEIRKFVTITNGTINQITGKLLTLTNWIDDSDALNVYSQTPYKVSVTNDENATLYKFIVSCEGQWRVEEYYSPTNTFVWIPGKSGNYSIQVRMNNINNFGYADTVASFNIEVINKPQVTALLNNSILTFNTISGYTYDLYADSNLIASDITTGFDISSLFEKTGIYNLKVKLNFENGEKIESNTFEYNTGLINENEINSFDIPEASYVTLSGYKSGSYTQENTADGSGYAYKLTTSPTGSGYQYFDINTSGIDLNSVNAYTFKLYIDSTSFEDASGTSVTAPAVSYDIRSGYTMYSAMLITKNSNQGLAVAGTDYPSDWGYDKWMTITVNNPTVENNKLKLMSQNITYHLGAGTGTTWGVSGYSYTMYVDDFSVIDCSPVAFGNDIFDVSSLTASVPDRISFGYNTNPAYNYGDETMSVKLVNTKVGGTNIFFDNLIEEEVQMYGFKIYANTAQSFVFGTKTIALSVGWNSIVISKDDFYKDGRYLMWFNTNATGSVIAYIASVMAIDVSFGDNAFDISKLSITGKASVNYNYNTDYIAEGDNTSIALVSTNATTGTHDSNIYYTDLVSNLTESSYSYYTCKIYATANKSILFGDKAISLVQGWNTVTLTYTELTANTRIYTGMFANTNGLVLMYIGSINGVA